VRASGEGPFFWVSRCVGAEGRELPRRRAHASCPGCVSKSSPKWTSRCPLRWAPARGCRHREAHTTGRTAHHCPPGTHGAQSRGHRLYFRATGGARGCDGNGTLGALVPAWLGRGAKHSLPASALARRASGLPPPSDRALRTSSPPPPLWLLPWRRFHRLNRRSPSPHPDLCSQYPSRSSSCPSTPPQSPPWRSSSEQVPAPRCTEPNNRISNRRPSRATVAVGTS